MPAWPTRRSGPVPDADVMTSSMGVTGEDAVRVSGLRKRYGGRIAVDGIDLQVRRGEVFALLGPNGAG
jgi:ABC-2 type transport system ATP-binding protein